MSDYIYAIGPNGTPVRYSGAARPPKGLEIVPEAIALSMNAEIAAADHVAIAAAQAKREKVLAGAFASLISGTKLTAEEATALGARPLRGEGEG